MALEDIFHAILNFDQERVRSLTQAEVDQGTDLELLLNQALINAMDEVGKRFSAGELFVPEMLMAAQAMKGGLEILRPLLAGGASTSKGTVVIGTVKGDLHDIGKNLVTMMLEGAGFSVVDLGVDVSAEKFVEAAHDHHAGVVALSALLTTTMPAMEDTIGVLKTSGGPFKTIVGGAPVTEAFANQIGADGYSDEAPGAVDLARKLLAP